MVVGAGAFLVLWRALTIKDLRLKFGAEVGEIFALDHAGGAHRPKPVPHPRTANARHKASQLSAWVLRLVRLLLDSREIGHAAIPDGAPTDRLRRDDVSLRIVDQPNLAGRRSQ